MLETVLDELHLPYFRLCKSRLKKLIGHFSLRHTIECDPNFTNKTFNSDVIFVFLKVNLCNTILISTWFGNLKKIDCDLHWQK